LKIEGNSGPENGVLEIELEGDFAAMLALGQDKNPRRGEATGVQDTLVAATGNTRQLTLHCQI